MTGMIGLRLLGGLTLEDNGTPLSGPATRRMSLALLALLAAAEARGIAREQLLVFLWPESNTQRARNSLNQTLYAIRQQLGEDVVIGTTSLRLNPERVTCDLWEYREALKRGDLAAAVRLREGELLETFALPGLPEFEQWLAAERSRDARAFREALERAARGAAREGDQRAATAYWKWLAVEEPLSARVARGCVLALAASGDLSGALAQVQAYAARVRGELGTEPADDVLLLATEIRNRLAGGDAEAAVPIPATAAVLPNGAAAMTAGVAESAASETVHVSVRPAEPGLAAMAPSDDVRGFEPTAAPGVRPAPEVVPVVQAHTHAPARETLASEPVPTEYVRGPTTTASRPPALVLALLSAVALVAVGVWWLNPRAGVGSAETSPAVAGDTRSILIFPFTVHGGTDAQHLSLALPSLLVSSLDGAGNLRAAGLGVRDAQVQLAGEIEANQLEAEAARRGVEFFVMGNVVASNEKLRVRASLHRRDVAEPLATATVEGVSTALFDLADGIALELLQRWMGAAHGRSLRPGAAITASLPALRAYLVGEAALEEDRYAEAIEAFRRAVTEDSTFALAYYRMSVAADLGARQPLAVEAVDRALRYAAQLPERERLLIAAFQALHTGRVDAAESLYRQVAEEYPSDPEGWFGLAESLFHHGPLRGETVTAARPVYERVLQLDPADAESLVHLARIAALEGRTAQADSLVQRARRVVPDSDAIEIRAVRAFALGDRPGFKFVTRQLLAAPRRFPAATPLQVAVYLDDLAGAESFAGAFLDPAEPRITRSFAHRLRAQIALARGQVARAEQELALSTAIDPTATLELRSLYVTFAPFAFPRSTVADVLRAYEEFLAPDAPADSLHNAAHAGLHEHIRLHRLGVLRLTTGDAAGAADAATKLQQLQGDERSRRYAHTLAWSIRARIAAADGQPEVALAALDRADWMLAAEVFVAEVADRFLRAELLEQVGRPQEALRWYESIAQRAIYELVYLAPAELRQATIHDRLGNRAEALRHYVRFVDLWRASDVGLRPQVQQVERRISELERAR